jgi:hypothetical protein
MNPRDEVRKSTSVHEAAHAVMGHVLGVRFLSVALLDENEGEAVPECSSCDACLEYYQLHDPDQDDHSKRIQDDLRRGAAIALVGEIGEVRVFYLSLAGGNEACSKKMRLDVQRSGSDLIVGSATFGSTSGAGVHSEAFRAVCVGLPSGNRSVRLEQIAEQRHAVEHWFG